MKTVSISITRCNRDRTPYELRIKDESSRALVCEIRMTAAEFAEEITGMYQNNVEVKWGDLGLIGKVYEIKNEIVEVPEYESIADRDRLAKEAVQQLETDGWRGRVEDALNQHKRIGPGQYKVTFVRYVDAADHEDHQ